MQPFYFEPETNREQKYIALMPQIASLLKDETDRIANMANVASALKSFFDFHWVGFYRNINEILVLGPFQGSLACTKIPFGKGVCGTSALQQKTIIVPNVDLFEGHIACSSLSKSEIVIPCINKSGIVEFVLDIDSDILNDFDEKDAYYLEKIVRMFIHDDTVSLC